MERRLPPWAIASLSALGLVAFWWIASVIAAVFSGLLFALFVLAFADAAFSPLGAFLIYLCMSWVCGLPALLIMRRNWRRQQLPDPVAIFE